MKKLNRLLLLVAMTLVAVLPLRAADYVFEYNGGYLYVTNGGAVGYTTTFSRSCVWTCVSNTSSLAAANLGNTSRYLYTEVNGTRYWLVGSTTNGNAVTVTTTAPGTAYWRNDGTRLLYRDGSSYYLYYRDSQWRVSSSQGGNYNYNSGTNYYSGRYNDPDYRSTTTAGTNVALQVTGYSVTTVTIEPSATQTLDYGGSATYSVSATATQTVIPAHTTFEIGDWWTTTYHFYNSQLSTDANDFAADEPATPEFTYAWALSGDGANGLEFVSGSSTGPNTIVNYSASASGTTATLTATATVGTSSRSASVTINVTPVEPSAISATGTTLYVGGNGTVAYSLTPDYAYHRVNVASSNTGVFTVTSPATTGAVDITPVAPGTATLTLTALNSDGSDGPSTSVDIIVRDVCAAPQFAFAQSGSDITVTLTTATLGATIRYTTDGSDPTPTTGTVYSDPFNVADGTTIKAIAVKDGNYDPSDVTVKTVRPIDYIQQGVSGGIVTLNDLEDHSWSYYSDSLCPIRSLNPADVKITYYGNGTGTVQTNNNDAPSTWGANATTVKVGIDADASTFEYYETLERTNGRGAASKAAANGRCAYTTIANPFSVRPTYDSDGTSKYRGFYGWRVKKVKNGTIHSAATGGTTYAANSIINAETEIFFNPTNEYGMEVEFEALWARAYVSTSGVPSNSLGVERNFYVITTSDASNITAGGNPCTYTSIYPNGTTNGTTAATSVTVYKRSTFTASADSKIEYIRLNNNNNNTITAAGYNLTIGRGVTAYNGTYCAATIRGMGGGSTTALDYTIRVESGAFENFYLVSSESQTYSNTVSTKAVFGCDYDRASNANNLLSIAPSGSSNHKTGQNAGSGEIYGGSQMRCTSSSNKENLSFDWLIKSGTFHEDQLGSASGGDESIYIGSSQSGSYNLQYIGKRRMIVEGGDLAGIAGGMNSSTANGGSNYNNTTHVTQSADDYVVIRIKGGNMRSSVYGAAAFAGASGGRTFIFTGGNIAGWVAGGANGTRTDGGTLYGPTNLYIGGNTEVNSHASTDVINRAVGGNVFGAGCGYGSSSNSGQILNYSTTVVLADEAYVERGVYGGGSYGYTTNTANLYILGGTVGGQPGGVNGTTYNADIAGGVFGGACQNQGGTVNIYMNGGLVEGGLYGGSNANGNIQNNVTMHIDGGQVGTSTQSANIHGGGYGSDTRVLGSVNLALGKEDCSSVLGGVTVFGDVYGGSAEGRTNGDNSRNGSAETNVTLYHGTINGALYGGGLGSNSNPAIVYGPVAVKVFGGSVRTNDGSGENGSGGVFGCNNVNGTPQSTVTVDIYGTDPAPDANSFALFAVYGGGNRSHYTAGVPRVTVHGCNNHIEYVYGGGNASDVPGTNITIWGGHIGNAFGGGNGYSVTGNHNNASADHYNPGANITTSGANITIHGGTIDAAFGGSNQCGTINGGITVNVLEQDEPGSNPCSGAAYGSCSNIIVELYGGGNEAPAQGSDHSWISPSVNITSCDMKITNLFGGAKNANHGTNINLVVTKGQFQNVFGGNNLGGTITGNVSLTLNGGTMLNAFGGNNQGGNITGTITVIVDDAEDTECPLKVDNVYGGGYQAAYTPNDPTAATPTVNFVNGTVRNAVFGGGLGDAAKITANPTVTIGGTGAKKAIVGAEKINGGQGVGNVYGGGSQADVLKNGDNTGNTSVTLTGNAEVKGNVYGGGNEATVEGNSDVKLQ